MRKPSIAIGILIAGSTGSAWAADLPKSINEPPRGPGTEEKSTLMPEAGRVKPGWEVSGQIGGGIGWAVGARAGYTIDYGVYFGASYTHYWGSSVPTVNGDQRTSRNLFGADVGYKMFFFSKAFEVRPYVFLGADFNHQDHPETLTVSSETGFAVAPGVLAAYHFGPAFVSGEVRVMITPTPPHVAGFGGFGLEL
jgi:hypothetical protein